MMEVEFRYREFNSWNLQKSVAALDCGDCLVVSRLLMVRHGDYVKIPSGVKLFDSPARNTVIFLKVAL